jgi:integrase
MKLTDMTIRTLPTPEKSQRIYYDESILGFGCRVSQGGTRSFVVMHGRSRRITTIGRYPTISLAQARQRAKEILAERVLGKTRAPTHLSFGDAVTTFIETSTVRESTKREYQRVLKLHFLPKLRLEPLERIHTETLMRIIDRLAATPSEARHAYAIASTLFNWAVRRRTIDRSPLMGVPKPKDNPPRDRVLTDTELAVVLMKANEQADAVGWMVRLLILTGQRWGEICGMRWSYIDQEAKTITWPGSAVKNGRKHTIPYGAATAAVLAPLPHSGDLLFPARGHADRPFNGWSKNGMAFIRSCAIEPWTIHDLRRTFASGMQRLGVRIEVTEKLLNHASGSLAGIVGVYQRHNYADEMREAIALWEAHIQSVLLRVRTGQV